MSDKQKVAVIGGGLSGLIAANQLNKTYDVQLFEKARGVGGRMSTRRAEPYQFDHGAQYFTARSKAFQDFLKPHISSGLVQEWQPKILTLEKGQKPYKRDWFEPHYVCAPRMNSLCKQLSKGIESLFSVEITNLSRHDEAWTLEDKSGEHHGPFDWVVMAVPSHQALNLLPSNFQPLEAIRDVQMTGCYSVMLGFDVSPKLNWDIAMPKNSLIKWVAVNSTKPDRDTAPSILIQTTNEWADIHMDDNVEDMAGIIINEFCELSGVTIEQIKHQVCHRWKYADTLTPAKEEFFLDQNLNIGVCGDWCIKGRIESAFLSAHKLCKKIID